MATKTIVCPECQAPAAPGRFACAHCGALLASVAVTARTYGPTAGDDAPDGIVAAESMSADEPASQAVLNGRSQRPPIAPAWTHSLSAEPDDEPVATSEDERWDDELVSSDSTTETSSADAVPRDDQLPVVEHSTPTSVVEGPVVAVASDPEVQPKADTHRRSGPRKPRQLDTAALNGIAPLTQTVAALDVTPRAEPPPPAQRAPIARQAARAARALIVKQAPIARAEQAPSAQQAPIVRAEPEWPADQPALPPFAKPAMTPFHKPVPPEATAQLVAPVPAVAPMPAVAP
ncbi:MAG TPA: hypothetical protein VIM39_04200, partial [Candidatus Limnocylindrales bacterium]